MQNNYKKSQLPLPPGPPLWTGIRDYWQGPPQFFEKLVQPYVDVVRWRGIFTIYTINHPDYVLQHHPDYWTEPTKFDFDCFGPQREAPSFLLLLTVLRRTTRLYRRQHGDA